MRHAWLSDSRLRLITSHTMHLCQSNPDILQMSLKSFAAKFQSRLLTYWRLLHRCYSAVHTPFRYHPSPCCVASPTSPPPCLFTHASENSESTDTIANSCITQISLIRFLPPLIYNDKCTVRRKDTPSFFFA
ncbi:hypothetical protein E2C01_064192 [Portunus trituberculatus]|uniref:Uncharacterized protein n=1 Tax=Portunus trituberculatus TaxID=210409 RepID=A0A5B7HJQ4_PORTR|nr:hypothetical protein [Portunus trituberculatus]